MSLFSISQMRGNHQLTSLTAVKGNTLSQLQMLLIHLILTPCSFLHLLPFMSLTPPSPLPHLHAATPLNHFSLICYILHSPSPVTSSHPLLPSPLSPLPLHFTHPSYHTLLILTLHYLSTLPPNTPHTHPSHIPSRPSSHPEGRRSETTHAVHSFTTRANSEAQHDPPCQPVASTSVCL